jgi:hypothetical protein
MHRTHTTGTSAGRRRAWVPMAVGVATAGVVVLGSAVPAVATVTSSSAEATPSAPIDLVVTNPRPSDVAGRGGDFIVDIHATGRTVAGDFLLSARNGYRPGLNLPPAATFGPGKPDPDAPGLVVLLSTTPQSAGGPNANLAGVFQLNTVTRHLGRNQILNTWEVGAPGFFGTNQQVTLTAFLVSGTAPGVVDVTHVHPISDVVRERFTIGS